MKLTEFDVDAFLREAWQKKPLLIRNRWDSWRNPLDPDELAGLACEGEVESRLITGPPDTFELEHGPLSAKRFDRLGKAPWTLLVQAVDHHAPAVAALLSAFRFIPNWRIDDVMVSYAVDGGGVGPHFDNYDVFLVQGHGKRRWQVAGPCDNATELLPHDDLRLLAEFEPTDEWILEPGDILYVPPRFGHNGVAVGDGCMTYSIGFRAPSRRELIESWCEELLAELEDDDRYVDPDLTRQENPGQISVRALADLHALVAEKLLDREAFGNWFGRFCTTPKNPEIDWRPEEQIRIEDLRPLLAEPVTLLRNPASRFSFIRRGPGSVSLFVDGQCSQCTGETASFAERLCAEELVPVGGAMPHSNPTLELILDLVNRGNLTFATEDGR